MGNSSNVAELRMESHGEWNGGVQVFNGEECGKALQIVQAAKECPEWGVFIKRRAPICDVDVGVVFYSGLPVSRDDSKQLHTSQRATQGAIPMNTVSETLRTLRTIPNVEDLRRNLTHVCFLYTYMEEDALRERCSRHPSEHVFRDLEKRRSALAYSIVHELPTIRE